MKASDPKPVPAGAVNTTDKSNGRASGLMQFGWYGSRGLVWPGVAVLVALSVFGFEVWSGSDVSYAVLYAIVVIIGSRGWGRRAAAVWTAVCALLACVGYSIARGQAGEVATLEFAIALVAITTTGNMMWSRVNNDKASRQVRHDLQVIADSMPQVLWGTNAHGKCDFLNARYTELLGGDIETTIRDQSWAEPVHVDDREEMFRVWRDAIEKNAPEFRAYGRVRHKDGSFRWMHSVGRSIRSPDTGEIVRWFGGLLDVDAEFRAQETIRALNAELANLVQERTAQLAQTEWRFRSLFDDANVGVIEQDFGVAKRVLADLKRNGVRNIREYLAVHPDVLEVCRQGMRLVDANRTLVDMLGYSSREQMIERPPTEGSGSETRLLPKQLEAMFDGLKTVNGTTVLAGPDGKGIPVAYAVHLKEDGTAFSTLFDISERERVHERMLGAQQELASANRLATIGALSVSMAHELNQPIWSISMDMATSMRTLASDMPDYGLLKQVLERVNTNTKRLADIVQRTREKVAGNKRSSEATDVVKLAHETCNLLAREAAIRRASVAVVAGDEVSMVAGDRVELQQVLVNLLINALDAVMHVAEDRRSVEISIDRSGDDHVRIRVIDRGPGIAEENLKRIFDPFFTTKSEGIGMGLEICRTTVEGLGGSLVAANRPDGGAVFEFALSAA